MVVEVLIEPNHRERILMALSKVPVATTAQLAMLNDCLSPSKRASEFLRSLEKDRLVMSRYYGEKKPEKIWRLTERGRRQTGTKATRLTNIDHSLAVGALYFDQVPEYFLFEPVENFTHRGKEMFWAPDAITVLRVGNKNKAYVIEVQLTHLTPRKWSKKWGIYNMYFNRGNYASAVFQSWSKSGRVILPQFVAITNQKIEDVKAGFEIDGRELIVTRKMC